jgi:hypothetical protein
VPLAEAEEEEETMFEAPSAQLARVKAWRRMVIRYLTPWINTFGSA